MRQVIEEPRAAFTFPPPPRFFFWHLVLILLCFFISTGNATCQQGTGSYDTGSRSLRLVSRRQTAPAGAPAPSRSLHSVQEQVCVLDPGHPSGTKPPVPQSCTSPVCPITDHELPGAVLTSWPVVGATFNLSEQERVAAKLPSD